MTLTEQLLSDKAERLLRDLTEAKRVLANVSRKLDNIRSFNSAILSVKHDANGVILVQMVKRD